MSDTTSDQPRTNNEYLKRQYERQVERVAVALVDLAATVRRSTKPHSSYVDAASYLVHDIHNALPNLPLELLIQAARDVDTLTEPEPES